MNKKQISLLYIAAAVIVLMGLFPPWTSQHLRYEYQYHSGYYALWNTFIVNGSINYGLLLVQWIGVCLVTGALWLAFKDRSA